MMRLLMLARVIYFTMGCINTRQTAGRKMQIPHAKSLKAKIKQRWTCPNCLRQFAAGQFLEDCTEHVLYCITKADDSPNTSIFKNKPQIVKIKSAQLLKEKLELKSKEEIFVLNPKSQEGIEFNWSRVSTSSKNPKVQLQKMGLQQIKSSEFPQKLKWFRSRLDQMKISWEKGCEWIEIDKSKAIETTSRKIYSIDLKKQVKIKFTGERANDAGGLLRQWVYLISRQVLTSQVFDRADTKQLTYKLKLPAKQQVPSATKLLRLYGRVLAKAVLQNIPTSIYLDHTILRQLSGQQLELCDVYSFDKTLYHSWSYILNQNLTGVTDFNFTIMAVNPEDGRTFDHQLIPNGAQILVNEDNKRDFIRRCINYLCRQRLQDPLNSLKQGFHSLIPQKQLSIFQPHEIEMILHGVPFIDIEDWEANTIYMGAYHRAHKTICWFWEFVKKQPQTRLSKLLQFCTGTSRTPLHGFKKLETNRGEQNQFTIQSCTYDRKSPYPKGHTCFNRLELPVYSTQEALQEMMNFILEAEFEGVYGLD